MIGQFSFLLFRVLPSRVAGKSTWQAAHENHGAYWAALINHTIGLFYFQALILNVIFPRHNNFDLLRGFKII